MKHFPKSVLALLVVGLLMTSLPLIINRHFPIPDLLQGFLSGLGLALEFMALAKMQRHQKNVNCRKVNNQHPHAE